jgi:hypothetical protein
MHLFDLRVRSASARRGQSVFSEEGVMSWISLSELMWPMKVNAVPNIPTLIDVSRCRERHPFLVTLIPRPDGGFVAETTKLGEKVPWPSEPDPQASWTIDEMTES